MSWIKTLAENKIKKSSDHIHRDIQIPNIDHLHTIGIIWNGDMAGGYQLMKKKFKGTNITIDSVLFDENIKEGTTTIRNRELNWLKIPKHQFIRTFLEKEVDLLINLVNSDELKYKYVNNLSRAKFKVGFSEEKNDNYDLTILTYEKEDYTYLIDKAFQYLRILNKN